MCVSEESTCTTTLTYKTSGQLGSDREDLGLEVLDHRLHARTQDVQVGVIAELEKICRQHRLMTRKKKLQQQVRTLNDLFYLGCNGSLNCGGGSGGGE